MSGQPLGSASHSLDGHLLGGSILELGHVSYLSHVLPAPVQWIAIGSSGPQPSAALDLAGPGAPFPLLQVLRRLSRP